jgi:hypothetical protein
MLTDDRATDRLTDRLTDRITDRQREAWVMLKLISVFYDDNAPKM